MPSLNYITPAQFYHKLRKRLAPGFQPRPECEVTYWQAYTTLCQQHHWDPYETIEVVFQYIAWKISREPNYILRRGYPNVVQMTSEELPFTAWHHCSKSPPSFRFKPLAQSQIETQIQLLQNTAIATNRSIEIVAQKDQHLPISPLLRLTIAPSLLPKLSSNERNYVAKEAKDITLWRAIQSTNVAPTNIQQVAKHLARWQLAA